MIAICNSIQGTYSECRKELHCKRPNVIKIPHFEPNIKRKIVLLHQGQLKRNRNSNRARI